MTPVIWYESDGYRTDVPKLMGRRAAGAGFLRAFATHGRVDRLAGLVRTSQDRDEFVATMRDIRPGVPAVTIPIGRLGDVAQYGLISYPGPIDSRLTFARDLHGPRAWSLVGVTHTIASSAIMDTVTGWLTAPLHPWDAVICTSQAVLKAVQRMIEAQAELLKDRLGARRFPLPRLPVIPLGVDCDALAISTSDRGGARSELGIAEGDIVVLFVGRISFHAKANPGPMYLALERLAAGQRVVLIECGWTANDSIAKAFADARSALCPSVRSIVLDGRVPAQLRRAWSAADIFCSLSDNIQETFGLTPIEAMAAGLPSVVSDWDGYRDTVRDGVDGIAVPTIAPPPGTGGDIALAHALDPKGYDAYIARAALATVVDLDATSAALERLATNAELRRTMGDSARRRAREIFDWRVIIRAYEELWAELDKDRRAQSDAAPGTRKAVWPARLDPFDLFESYPTRTLDESDIIRLTPAATTEAFEERLRLAIAGHAVDGTTFEALTGLRDSLRGKQLAVGEFLRSLPATRRPKAVRALLLLAKFGLLTFGR